MTGWRGGLVVVALLLAVLPVRAATAAAQLDDGSRPGDPALSVEPAAVRGAMSCRGPASGGGRDPVLLVHGTLMTGAQSFGWNYLPELAARGYRVCTVDLPERSLGDIQAAAEFVVVAVHRLARESGRKVDVLGHSQGALQARWAVRWWPSVQAEVDDLVSLAGPNHGTTVPLGGLVPASGCAACAQMVPGSAFLTALNGGGWTPGQASLTSLYSTLVDELIAPNATAARIGGASNIALQSVCAGRVVTHGSIVVDAAAFALVVDALAQPGAAAPSRFDHAACLGTTFIALPPPLTFEALLRPVSVPAGGAIRTAEPPLRPYALPAGPPAPTRTSTAPAATTAPAAVVAPPGSATKTAPTAVVPVLSAPPGASISAASDSRAVAPPPPGRTEALAAVPARSAEPRSAPAPVTLAAGLMLALVAGAVLRRRRTARSGCHTN